MTRVEKVELPDPKFITTSFPIINAINYVSITDTLVVTHRNFNTRIQIPTIESKLEREFGHVGKSISYFFGYVNRWHDTDGRCVCGKRSVVLSVSKRLTSLSCKQFRKTMGTKGSVHTSERVILHR